MSLYGSGGSNMPVYGSGITSSSPATASSQPAPATTGGQAKKAAKLKPQPLSKVFEIKTVIVCILVSFRIFMVLF